MMYDYRDKNWCKMNYKFYTLFIMYITPVLGFTLSRIFH